MGLSVSKSVKLTALRQKTVQVKRAAI